MTGEQRPAQPVRDRQVLLVAAAVVALVLGLLAVSAYVPALGDAFALAPVLIFALVVVTAVVLFRAVRRSPPTGGQPPLA